MLHRILAIAAALVVFSACSNPITPDAAESRLAKLGQPCSSSARAFSLPQAKLDSIGPYQGPLYMDAEWAGYARQVPGGFGGLYYATGTERQMGPLTIRLVDPSQRTRALKSLVQLFRGKPEERLISELSGAVAKQARWDFAQLFDWRRYLDRHALGVQGLTSADIDEVQNRIVYGVENEPARERLNKVLQQFDLPCDLVSTSIVPPAQFW